MNEPKDPEAIERSFLMRLVGWLFPTRNVLTGNPGTGLRPPDEVVRLLGSIDSQLKTPKCSSPESDTINHERTQRPRGGGNRPNRDQ